MSDTRVTAINVEDSSGAVVALYQSIADGFLYTHSRLNANTSKTLESASFLYALIELLAEKGVLSIEELDERKRIIGERLAKQYSEKGIGAIFQDPEYDKYTFDQGATVDCAEYLPLCKAACCRLPFALSKQDVREGVVHWDLGQPYLIDQGQDGYCVHMDRGACTCTIYTERPVPCRGFDCRTDKRIWLDFEKKEINPAVNQPDWPRSLQQKDDNP